MKIVAVVGSPRINGNTEALSSILARYQTQTLGEFLGLSICS